MRELLNRLIELTLDFRELAGNFLVPLLPFLYIVSILISFVLIWGIIYAVARSGWIPIKLDRYSDMFHFGDVGKRKQLRSWKRIVFMAKTDDINSWKKAILNADKIFDDVLKMSGYRGDTVHARFQQLPPEALSNREDIVQAHKIRDKIMQEPDFQITQAETISALKIYQKAFQELGLIE